MIVVLRRGITDAQIEEILGEFPKLGIEGRVIRGASKPVIHILSGTFLAVRPLLRMDRVEAIVRTDGPRIRKVGRPFFPHHFINWCVSTLLALAGLIVLAGFLPPGLGSPVDVTQAPGVFSSPWYARAFEKLISLAPPAYAKVAPGATFLMIVVIFFLPLWDRGEDRRLIRRLPVLLLGTAVLAGFIYLSIVGLF